MTADFLAFHAAERPDAVALLAKGRPISYAQFSADVRRFARALRGLGLPQGSTVAVCCDDLYLHWLLLLALERLRLVSVSFLSAELEDVPQLLASADLVLSERAPLAGGGTRHHAITPAWLGEVFALPDAPEERFPTGAPDDPLRIVRTSGTTGQSKRLLLRRRVEDAWIDRWAWFLELTRERRYLLTMPFTVNAIYTVASAVIRWGGTVVWDVFEDAAAVLGALSRGITDVVVLPIQLKQMLDALPDDFRKPADLTVTIIGAAAPEILRQRALARLAKEIVVGYGANEMPFITQWRASSGADTGLVLPWVEAEAVDEEDRPLPQGSLGRIRVRTGIMAEGYLDDPEATRRMFRGGWFHPGDMGVLDGGRRLRVAGRADELLNLGGSKFSPSALEGLVLAHLAVGDVGVCSIQGPEGMEEVCVALVDARQSEEELLAGVARAFSPYPLGRFHVVTLDRIPRNPVGKIQRDRLKSAVASRLRRS